MHSPTLAQALGLVLTGIFTVAGAASAAETSPATAPQTVMVQGVQVAIDPSTGRLREPTAAERASLAKAFQANGGNAASLSTQPRTAARYGAAAGRCATRARTGASRAGAGVRGSARSTASSGRAEAQLQ